LISYGIRFIQKKSQTKNNETFTLKTLNQMLESCETKLSLQKAKLYYAARELRTNCT